MEKQPVRIRVEGASRYQVFLRRLDNQIREFQVELDQLRQRLITATVRKRRNLQAAIGEAQSELELAETRRDSLRTLAEFASGAMASGSGATGLRGQIDARPLCPRSPKPAFHEGGNEFGFA